MTKRGDCCCCFQFSFCRRKYLTPESFWMTPPSGVSAATEPWRPVQRAPDTSRLPHSSRPRLSSNHPRMQGLLWRIKVWVAPLECLVFCQLQFFQGYSVLGNSKRKFKIMQRKLKIHLLYYYLCDFFPFGLLFSESLCILET